MTAATGTIRSASAGASFVALLRRNAWTVALVGLGRCDGRAPGAHGPVLAASAASASSSGIGASGGSA